MMKNTKRILALVLVLLIAVTLFGCNKSSGSSSSESDSDSSAAAADPAPAAPVATEATGTAAIAGVYTLFGMGSPDLGDVIVDTDGLVTAVYTLNPDGTGTAVEDDEQMDITWTALGNSVTMTDDTGSTVTGTVNDGIMMIDIDGDTMYMAKEGADISSYELVSFSELMGVEE